MLWGSVADPRRARGFPLVFSAGPTAIMSILTSNDRLLLLLVILLLQALDLGSSSCDPAPGFWIRCRAVAEELGSCAHVVSTNANIRQCSSTLIYRRMQILDKGSENILVGIARNRSHST